jgi:uracil-DNA glycosylase family 4
MSHVSGAHRTFDIQHSTCDMPPPTSTEWHRLQQRIIACELCPRLRLHCEKAAREKRKAYRDQTYWAKPVPNLGPSAKPEAARLLIVGLAPAAHGANRTGRMFTGDRSGDFLFRSLHAAGFANQPTSRAPGDGLEMIDCVITAAAHCAPPANKPTREELALCERHLVDTFIGMRNLRAVLCLGQIAHAAVLRLYRRLERPVPSPQPKFAHGAIHELPEAPPIVDTYHPSQQNTFTGRLTEGMLTEVLRRTRVRMDRPD